MNNAIDEWSTSLHDDSLDWHVFIKRIQKSYVIYGRMLLLPWSAFESFSGNTDDFLTSDDRLRRLYVNLAFWVKITHIAVSRPIPALATGHDLSDEYSDNSCQNIIRAPLNFLPLHGDFGPVSYTNSIPTEQDFKTAFWTTARQNGIWQTWAPRWTMFSRGNISEKTRILSMPSVTQAIQEGQVDGKGVAVVDMYVGIGYFAFSYLKARVDAVVGWDLNPWSIEGCRRGALANKWTVSVVRRSSLLLAIPKSRLTLFHESNEHAHTRITEMPWLPPIRHVNCGLLPTSKSSWKIAVAMIDASRGGWVHIHENWAVKEIEVKASELVTVLRIYAHEVHSKTWTVHIERISRLKSYAPGVIHCVIDVRIMP